MATTDFIAAIELGSSRISGIAGRKNSDGSLHVLAHVSEDSSPFIHKGVIHNIDKTAQAVASIVKKLESELGSSIAKVYTGIGGQSLRTVENTVTRTLDEEGVITQKLVDSICDENTAVPLADMSTLDVAPQEYKIDNSLQADPVGVTGRRITARFLNIVARASLKKKLEHSFRTANVEIADLFTSPLALAAVALTESERRSGCALVDLGADTTTVVVYKNNLLRYLSVLPLGGNAITRDITTLRLEEDEAEQLKLRYGSALGCEEKEALEALAEGEGERPRTDLAQLGNIVEARTEEILANVWRQLKLSGYEDKLYAGIVLTGGGANLRSVDEALRRISKMDKVKVLRRIHPPVTGPDDIVADHSRLGTLLGLLAAGNEDCCRPAPSSTAGRTPDMFAGDPSLKEQEEAIRRQRDEKPTKAADNPVHSVRKPADDGKKPAAGGDREAQKPKPPKQPGWWKRTFSSMGDVADKFSKDLFEVEDDSDKM